jgi:hypothetical protein
LRAFDEPIVMRSAKRTKLRAAGVGLAVAGAAALLAACGSANNPGAASIGESASIPSSSDHSETLAYAACMRTHGEPDFPDPVALADGYYGFRILKGDGVVPGSPQFESAARACKSLVANITAESVSNPKQQSEWLSFAACIRSHGEPTFPDPTFPKGVMRIVWKAGSMSSPLFQAAVHACASLEPTGQPGLP